MEEVNCFFKINKIAKKIIIGTTVGLAALLILGFNILKDNTKILKSVLKINATNIIKVEGKIVSTDIIQGPTMMILIKKIGKKTIDMIRKISK